MAFGLSNAMINLIKGPKTFSACQMSERHNTDATPRLHQTHRVYIPAVTEVLNPNTVMCGMSFAYASVG